MMLHLAQGFVDRGLTVDLVLVHATGPNLAGVPASVRIVDLKCSHSRSSIGKLVRYLRRERPRSMLSALDTLNVVAIIAKWLSRADTRLAISLTCFISLVYDQRNADVYTRSIYARITFFALKVLYRFADRVVAISSGVADDCATLARIPRQKIEVFYVPVITPTLYERARQPVTHAWFHSNSPPVIIAVGRLSRAKDYPTLIRAFSILLKTRPARLLIVGEGECRPQLEKLVRELGLAAEVSLPGYVDNQYALMSRASARAELGTTMGIAQTFAGISRVAAPLLSTNLFQRAGHGAPFYFAATVVGLVSLLALQVEARTSPQPARVVD